MPLSAVAMKLPDPRLDRFIATALSGIPRHAAAAAPISQFPMCAVTEMSPFPRENSFVNRSKCSTRRRPDSMSSRTL